MIFVKNLLKKSLPWWARMASKFVLARLPAGYAFWQKLGLFRHGDMDEAAYAISVFELHVHRVGFALSELNGKVILEMGPGDSVSTAIIAHAWGARAILVDAGAFASPSLLAYGPLCKALTARGLKPIDLSLVTGLDEMLAACHAMYLTNGAAAWQSVASNSVDFVFSQAVLEHVRLHEFAGVQKECFRVLKSGGLASHRVDLKDHLGGALNNLRFSKKVWESDLFVKSGFYTNRIRMTPMLEIFSDAGFGVKLLDVSRWKSLPTELKWMDSEFSSVPNAELLVSGFDVLLSRGSIANAG